MTAPVTPGAIRAAANTAWTNPHVHVTRTGHLIGLTPKVPAGPCANCGAPIQNHSGEELICYPESRGTAYLPGDIFIGVDPAAREGDRTVIRRHDERGISRIVRFGTPGLMDRFDKMMIALEWAQAMGICVSGNMALYLYERIVELKHFRIVEYYARVEPHGA